MRSVVGAGLVLGLGNVAQAEPANLFGGRIVPTRQAYVSGGFPYVEGGVRAPFGGAEFGVRLRLTYGVTFSPIPTTVAVSPGLDLRLQLMDSGALSGSFVASIDVGIGFPQAPVAVGIGLISPGWLMTYRVADRVDVDFGLRLRDDLWIQGPNVFFLLAVPITLGLEWAPTEKITLGVVFEGGPAFGAALAGGVPTVAAPVLPVGGVGARVSALFGASFAF